MLFEGHEFCHFCSESTWIKPSDVQIEHVGGVRVVARTKDGFCKGCGRRMLAIKIIAIEEEVGNEEKRN